MFAAMPGLLEPLVWFRKGHRKSRWAPTASWRWRRLWPWASCSLAAHTWRSSARSGARCLAPGNSGVWSGRRSQHPWRTATQRASRWTAWRSRHGDWSLSWLFLVGGEKTSEIFEILLLLLLVVLQYCWFYYCCSCYFFWACFFDVNLWRSLALFSQCRKKYENWVEHHWAENTLAGALCKTAEGKLKRGLFRLNWQIDVH